MFLFGPASALFDFATFAIMLFIFKANASLFQTGWFVESLITEVLVIFIIRTRRVPFFKSHPSPLLILFCLSVVLLGIVAVYTPLAHLFGFTHLPPLFFAYILAFVAIYLTIVESLKRFIVSPQSTQDIIKP